MINFLLLFKRALERKYNQAFGMIESMGDPEKLKEIMKPYNNAEKFMGQGFWGQITVMVGTVVAIFALVMLTSFIVDKVRNKKDAIEWKAKDIFLMIFLFFLSVILLIALYYPLPKA